eukprot:5755633-Pyramimonas_sp.AAC.1
MRACACAEVLSRQQTYNRKQCGGDVHLGNQALKCVENKWRWTNITVRARRLERVARIVLIGQVGGRVVAVGLVRHAGACDAHGILLCFD